MIELPRSLSAGLRVVGPSPDDWNVIVDHMIVVTVRDEADKLSTLKHLTSRLVMLLEPMVRPRFGSLSLASLMSEDEMPACPLPAQRVAEVCVNGRLWSRVWVTMFDGRYRADEEAGARYGLCRKIVEGIELAPWSPPMGALRESSLDPPAVGDDFELQVVGPKELEALWVLQGARVP